MTNKIRVVAAVAVPDGATLYAEDGTTLNLKASGYRTQDILDQVIEPLATGNILELDLDDFSLEKAVESKTNGLIKFLTEGLTQLLNGVKSFEEPAKPLVAVVGKKKIEGVEKLAKHIEAAVATGNVKGLERFMVRVAGMKHKDAVQDLLTFMERGDLPIADDGSIVAYKVLSTHGDADGKEGRFFDCHTHKVPQKLGSRVSMDRNKVDPSRRNDCSQGLHIARRGYLGGFSGDVIVIAKIAPEDVIAVPTDGRGDKVRVAAYHIVAVLPDRVHSILRSNKPMTGDEEAAKILGKVLAGNHVGVLEEVYIGGPMGQDVKVTPVKQSAAPKKGAPKAKAAKALDDGKPTADTKLEVANINDRVKAAKAGKPKPLSAKKQAALDAFLKNLPATQKKALKLIDKGLSQRQVEKELGIAAKTIRKLVRQRDEITA